MFRFNVFFNTEKYLLFAKGWHHTPFHLETHWGAHHCYGKGGCVLSLGWSDSSSEPVEEELALPLRRTWLKSEESFIKIKFSSLPVSLSWCNLLDFCTLIDSPLLPFAIWANRDHHIFFTLSFPAFIFARGAGAARGALPVLLY